MRLLQAETLRFSEFYEPDIPPYLILSHRWDVDEIMYQEVLEGETTDKKGWWKINEFCAFALKLHFDYVWIDTCCIDKRGLYGEASDAINSMFRWYHNARICYVYLKDVKAPDSVECWTDDEKRAFKSSDWFTRGWTLQELLAPKDVRFISDDWKTVIGTKQTLSTEIAEATGIDENLLVDFNQASIAAKMSWMSRRQCSRPEDMAYSMMGIFGAQMPMLYGEGWQNAFLRLQLEILKMTDDESIFVWDNDQSNRPSRSTGLLAPSPRCFANSGRVVARIFDRERPPYAMTNKGLLFEPLVSTISVENATQTAQALLAPLKCALDGDVIAIVFLLWDADESVEKYTRLRVVHMSSKDVSHYLSNLRKEQVDQRAYQRRRIYVPQDGFQYRMI